jgi:CheY-like chemotaxis protein
MSARDARMVDIVLTRANSPQYKFNVADAAALNACDIALVDMQSPHGPALFEQIRSRCPTVLAACVSDQGTLGDSRFRIARASLLLLLQRTLETMVREEVASHAKAPSTPSPRPAPSFYQFATLSQHASNSSTGPQQRPSTDTSVKVFHPLSALVVDDSLTLRRQLEAALERLGIRCVSAENADQAIGELARQTFELVFLDVVMPGMDGYELCRKIKHNNYTRGIPVTMLTSRSSPFDRARGALAGCNSYLVKPIVWDKFYANVDRLLMKQFHGNRGSLSDRGYRSTGTPMVSHSNEHFAAPILEANP